MHDHHCAHGAHGAHGGHPEVADPIPGLAGVKHAIAVSSCKGGVGKSTLAVNLAYSLARGGAKVGLFDADVYGPSLPTLVHVEGDTRLHVKDELIQPLGHEGVKLMSFGWATDDADGAAIMRGPMVASVISQLLGSTDWGELDYLVVDMPPGTGDVQLTLTQSVPFDGAVIVTTPQKLSLVDVIKGMHMFATVRVPTLAIVENMSHFVCGSCGEKHFPFGTGAREQLVERYGIQATFDIPVLPDVSVMGDKGRPVVLEQPDGELAGHYNTIAEAVVEEVGRLAEGELTRPKVGYDPERGILVIFPGGEEQTVDPADLRRRCNCAGCVNEHTGERVLRDEDVPDDVAPTEILPMGNYAVAIKWTDGHTTSIYPYERLLG